MKQVLARVDLQLWILLLQAGEETRSSRSEIGYSSSCTDPCAAYDGYPFGGSELLCEGVELLHIVRLDDTHGGLDFLDASLDGKRRR